MATACVRSHRRYGFLSVMLLVGCAFIDIKVAVVLKILLIVKENCDCNRHPDDLAGLVAADSFAMKLQRVERD